MKKQNLKLPLALWLLFVLARPALAQNAGELDPTFGTDGKAILDASHGSEGGYTTLVQPDGKIIVAGSTYNGESSTGFLLRYTSEGLLDQAFGEGGVVRSNAIGYYPRLALQADGKIMSIGVSSKVRRWTSDGKPDTTFGVGGELTDPNSDYFSDVAVTTEGKILISGSADAGGLVMRLLDNGQPDTTFSEDGRVTLPIWGWFVGKSFYRVSILPNGKVVAVGFRSILGDIDSLIVMRLMPDGQPDVAFGDAGVINFWSNHTFDAVVQPDEKIVLAGPSLIRLLENGLPDPAFGTNGIVQMDTSGGQSAMLASLVLQPDGRIAVAGQYQLNPAAPTQALLARFTSEGLADLDFGTNGLVVKSIAGITQSAFYSMALQPDGSILSAGHVRAALGNDAVLMRHLPDGEPDPVFGETGLVFKDFPSGKDLGMDVLANPDGTIYLATSSFGPGHVVAQYSTEGNLQTSQKMPGTPGVWARQTDGKWVLSGGYFSNTVNIWRVLPDGQPDQGFAQQGLFSLNLDQNYSAQPFDVDLQPDGKILLYSNLVSSIPYKKNVMLLRLNNNGTPDSSWGTDGIAILSVPGNEDLGARALALQPDGKVLVTGYHFYPTPSTYNALDVFVARLETDGTLDEDFGANGYVKLHLTNIWQLGYQVAIDGSGRILVAAMSIPLMQSARRLILARWLPTGAVDTGFGSNGKVSLLMGNDGDDPGVLFSDYRQASLALQSDGNILLAGTIVGPNSKDIYLTRRLPNGAADTDFGDNGSTIVDVSGYDDLATGVIIQAGGKILISGTAYNGQGHDAVLLRLLTDLVVGANELQIDKSTLLVYPNPVRDRALLRYTNPSLGNVTIQLENLQGGLLRTFFSGRQEAGEHTLELTLGAELPAGPYVCRLRIGAEMAAVRIVKQ